MLEKKKFVLNEVRVVEVTYHNSKRHKLIVSCDKIQIKIIKDTSKEEQTLIVNALLKVSSYYKEYRRTFKGTLRPDQGYIKMCDQDGDCTIFDIFY